ncbi:uncharacterized protein DEA37_0002850 [Paragonimus westermani]|uniref:EF-hand domain-containing protein n=1 Tax=Paragonimus westermani TaxID=34504 RepID=A0A5J4NFN5_9TREM|nr:uncharacterized protein DEA37_0002850 [Paragonimus westermani]
MSMGRMHDVEKMIDLFMEIDKNDDETVDKKELTDFYKARGVSQEQIDDWMKKFDTNDDGKITLMEFCRGLGIRADELRTEKGYRDEQRAGKAPKVASDIEIVASTMADYRKVALTEKFKELVKQHDGKESEMNQVALEFKSYLDENYGRVWQCVILTGSYWMHFSHEPFLSIQFKYGKYIALAWRTPQG